MHANSVSVCATHLFSIDVVVLFRLWDTSESDSVALRIKNTQQYITCRLRGCAPSSQSHWARKALSACTWGIFGGVRNASDGVESGYGDILMLYFSSDKV